MLELVQDHLTLLTVLVTAAAVLLALPSIASYIREPRALFTKPRPDLFTPSGCYPFIGHQLKIWRRSDRQPELWVEQQCERDRAGVTDPAKACSDTAFGRRWISIRRPEELEWVQRTNFKNYVKGPEQQWIMHELFGDGIFTSDGDLWVRQRKATSRVFTNKSYRGIISQSISGSLDVLDTVLAHYADSGAELNLGQVFLSFTLDTFLEMAYSAQPGALAAELDGKAVPFAKALQRAQVIISRRFGNPLWPLTEILTGDRFRVQADMKVVHAFADRIINEREKEFTAKLETGEQDGDDEEADTMQSDLLSRFLAIRDEDGKAMSKEAVRDATINLLLAGRDTTGGTLSWAIFHLLSYPPLIAHIRREAASLLSSEDDNKPGKVPFDRLKEASCTLAYWYEAARLHPAVPVNFWTALDDDQLPNGGPRVEKGDFVTWSDWATQRSREFWGPNAGAFDPARWLDEDGKFNQESEFKLHSFNGGRRRCLGETLATFEGVSVLLALFSRYDLAFAPDYLASTEMLQSELCADRTPRYGNGLTMPMLEPLRVVVSRRKEKEA
ncbi:hypothetical protein JCM10207_003512 [Rhodosporidiobolus poonsookiae]